MNEEVKNILLIIVACVVIMLIGIFFYSNSNIDPLSLSENQTKLIKSDSLTIGKTSAKVKIVEFADFECPACAAEAGVILKLLNDYKDNISLIFRHFPLDQHKNAFLAGKAVEAANEQGKFKEMYEKIYLNRFIWGDKTEPQTEAFIGFAREIGLDIAKFKTDILSDKYDTKIYGDRQDGIDLGINSTPTLIIGGKKYTSAMPYEDFKKIIDTELGK